MGSDHFNYKQAEVRTVQSGNQWALRKSEIISEIAQEVEDDYKAIELYQRERRERNLETFEERWLPRFKQWLGENIYWDEKKFCYTLQYEWLDAPVIIDYYPKGNKALIRKENRWIHGGLNWLRKDVLPMEYQDPRPDW